LAKEIPELIMGKAEKIGIASSFKIWRTLTLGAGPKTADAYCQALKAAGFTIDDWAKDILSKPAFTVAAKETKIDLVNVSVTELGFSNGASTKQIYDRAKELGLFLCPDEAGPALRLVYKDQPRGEWLHVAMESIADSVGDPDVFSVGHYVTGRWLRAYCDRPDDFWDASGRWVFALGK
jgi:hypothetical protein